MRSYGYTGHAGPTNIHTPPPAPRITYQPQPKPTSSSPFPPYDPNGNTPLIPSPNVTPKAVKSAPQRPTGIPRGEPTIWTQERVQEMERLLTEHRSILKAAEAMGITSNAARQIRRRYLKHVDLTPPAPNLHGVCVVCGSTFQASDFPQRQRQACEFSKRKTCGRSCAARLARRVQDAPQQPA